MKDENLLPTVVGIDIGTFTTKMSAVQRGAVDAIINEANFRETPSVIGFGQGERKIGELGAVKLKSNFKNTIVSPTRYLGLNIQSESVTEQLANCPCPTKFQGQVLHFKVNFNGIDESFTTEQILAGFMTKLSSTILNNNLDPKMIVFSVPSCLTQSQKKSILNAAQIAGMKNIRLATEAVCIGLDYGSYKKSEMGSGKNVVFIDFGYYQLSLSLIKFTSTTMEVITERSNRNLGCRDIDQKIFDYVAKRFEQKKGLNIKQSKRACLKLLEAIQKQRKILSGISQTQLSIQCLFQDEDLIQSFTRQIMINEVSQIFKEISQTFKDFKQEIEKRNIKIDSVQLIGGGSRIPKFIQLVQQQFKMNASRTTNSSQTISRGATLAAVQYSGLFRFDTFSIINKSLNSIVLSWKDMQGNMTDQTQYTALNNQTLVQSNEVIPCQKTLKLVTDKNIQILVSYDILDCAVQKKILKIKCQCASQNKNQLSLTFSINSDSFVQLLSMKDCNNKDIKYTVQYIRQLSPQKLLAYKAKQREMFVKDFSTVKLHQKRNQLQSFIYKQKQIINNEQFKKYVSPEQNQKAQQYLLQITNSLQAEDKQLGIKDYDKKKKDIEQEISKISQLAKKKKLQVQQYFKELQKLKIYASDAIKQITQKFRKSKPVSQCIQSIKQSYQWAEQAIKLSKTKAIQQLPAVSKQDIQKQYQNIKILVDQLINPPKPKPQPRHQHYEEHYDPNQYMTRSWLGPQNYRNDQDQIARMRQARLRRQQQQKLEMQRQQQQRLRQQRQQQPFFNGFHSPQNSFYPHHKTRYAQEQQRLRQKQQQEARRRQQQQQQQRQYDPFGTSRGGFFGPPSNDFFGGFF